MTRLVGLVLALVRALLPPEKRGWSDAAVEEARMIGRPGQALAFAFGCLAWAAGEAIRSRLPKSHQQGEEIMGLAGQLQGPRGVGLLCAFAATGLGLAYMASGGAPPGYLMMNAGAFAFGLVALALLGLADDRRHLLAGPINLLLGLTLLTVAIWGASAGGVTRWAALGPLIIQPSLMIVPLMAVLFARSRDAMSAGGVGVAALALALQPDRGVAGALAAGMVILVTVRRGPSAMAAAAFAALGFGAALAQPDPSPAMPFVDQILYSSFVIHPLAGLAVLAGSALLVGPALAGRRPDPSDRSTRLVFGGLWAALVVAAALGNYPTPLVGYGGSAIVGYLLSLIAFPRRAPSEVDLTRPSPSAAPDDGGPVLRAATR